MTPEAMRALPERLRAVESRSKAGLLEEAAAAIEALLHTLDELGELDEDAVVYDSGHNKSCYSCKHGNEVSPCDGISEEVDCFDCQLPCCCRDCVAGSGWELREGAE